MRTAVRRLRGHHRQRRRKDRTGEIADRLAEEHERVRAVHNRPNRGYGDALQREFKEASKDFVFYTDGDGQFDFGEMDKLLFRMHVRDVDCAFKIFPRRLFSEIEMHSTGALIDTEILAKARRRGYSIG